MKSLFIKDKFRRNLYKKLEKQRLVLLSIYKDMSLPNKLRMKAYYQLKNLPKNGSISRMQTRCLITNRSRSIYKKYKISRLVFRRLALKGELVGVRKSSW